MGSLIARTAETPAASTVHHPFGNPVGPGLFRVKGLQLPAYIQNVAHAFRRKGLSESESIARAVGVVKDWAAGRAPNGGHVHPDVQAAAAKAVAEWEAAKAAAHADGGSRFNPYHLPAGTGGGEFTTAGGSGGSGGKVAKSKAPAKRPTSKAAAQKKFAPHAVPGTKAKRDHLLDEAKAKRAEAHQLEQQLKTLEHQHAAAVKAAAKSAAAHKAALAKAKSGKSRIHHTHHVAVHHHHAKHAASLASRITSLKDRIKGLLKQAHALESQAHNLRNVPSGAVTVRNAGRTAGMPYEPRAQMTSASINDLPDDAFAYIEPGGTKDNSGKTMPRSLRHFPVHDAAHVRNALSRAPQSPFGAKAMPKIKAAAKKFGVNVSDNDGGRSVILDEEVRELRITSQYKDLDSRLELRSGSDGGQWIGGYASVFMPRESRNLGGFIERVAPDAFNEARASGWQDVVCRFNHNSDYVLGTAAAGTLQLRTDGVGLDYEVLPPVAEERIRELVERGDIRYSSFAFRVPQGGDEWGVTDQNFPMRTLHDVELVDVAPVLSPAYPDATAAVRATSPALRSLANHMQVAVDEVRALADADELRRLFIRTDRPMYKKETPRLFGPQAATLLLGRREDPYVDEG